MSSAACGSACPRPPAPLPISRPHRWISPKREPQYPRTRTCRIRIRGSQIFAAPFHPRVTIQSARPASITTSREIVAGAAGSAPTIQLPAEERRKGFEPGQSNRANSSCLPTTTQNSILPSRSVSSGMRKGEMGFAGPAGDHRLCRSMPVGVKTSPAIEKQIAGTRLSSKRSR